MGVCAYINIYTAYRFAIVYANYQFTYLSVTKTQKYIHMFYLMISTLLRNIVIVYIVNVALFPKF